MKSKLIPLLCALAAACTGADDTVRPVVVPSQSEWKDRGTILHRGECGDWDWRPESSPQTFFELDGRLYLVYRASDGSRPDAPCSADGRERNRRFGLLVSDDGLDWERHPKNPIVEHGLPSATGEAGVYWAASTVSGETVHLFVAALTEFRPEQVHSHVGRYTSTDGDRWRFREYALEAGELIGDDEIVPFGALVRGGRWHVYYAARGSDVERDWWMILASGDRPGHLTRARPVTPQMSVRGGGDVIRISRDRVIVPVRNTTDSETGTPIQVRSTPVDSLADLGTLETTWQWDDVGTVAVYLDRRRDRWLLAYGVDGPGRDDYRIGLKTAPVEYR